MKYFSVPCDFKKETIDQYARLNQKYEDATVTETYGNITVGNLFGSGRSHSQLPKVDFSTLKDFVNYSRKKGIHFDYTLNASHMLNREFTEAGILEIKYFLKKLYDTGVRYLTCTLPSLFDLIKSIGYDFRLKASAICSVDTPNQAMAVKKLGADKMVVKELINRDFHTLKQIRKCFGEEVEIIVNSPCHMDCTYRMPHYNQQSGDSIEYTNEISFNYYEHKCMYRRYDDITSWLKIIWVRPEDLKYYTAVGITRFKLQGRQAIIKGGDPVKTLEYYFKENFDGDMLDLINLFAPLNNFRIPLDNKKLAGFIKPFFENENFCPKDCSICSYCKDFAKKCLEIEKAAEVNRLAKKFYTDYDQYNRLIKKMDAEKVSVVKNIHPNDHESFDF